MRHARRPPRLFAASVTAVVLAVLGIARGAAALTLPPNQPGVYVYDLASIWSQSAEAHAQAVAEAVRTRTGAQIAVVSWPSGFSSVSTGTAAADARTIMDTWGVGQKDIDDGLVVLFDMDTTLRHGQIYLYTGRGYRDAYLSDPEAQDVVGDMLAQAKQGDLDQALVVGMDAVDHVTQPGGNPDRAGRAATQLALQIGLLGGGLAVLALFLYVWWSRGRDAVAPLIDNSVLLPSPPPMLTPAMAVALRKDRIDKDAFTAALVDLGHRGLVTFEAADKDDTHVDLVVPDVPLEDPNSLEARRRPLGAPERALASDISQRSSTEYADGARAGARLTWTKLRQGTGAKLFQSFKKDLGQAAKASGWFRDDPTRLTSRWAVIGIFVVVAAVVFFWAFELDRGDDTNLVQPGREYLIVPTIAVILIGIAIAVMSGRLAARTEDGARTLSMALAYRNTLRHEIGLAKTVDQAVETTQTRLPWITTPDLLTVWAVALGLNTEIDKLIKATMATAAQTGTTIWAPAWYSGSGGVTSVGDLSNAISSIGTTAASSSGGGYGGGGGGGGGGAGGGF